MQTKPVKTIRRTVRKTTPERLPPGTSEDRPHTTQLLSTTTQLPAEAFFEWMSSASTAHLAITCPGLSPWKVPLSIKEVTIGRDRTCRISLPLSNVSRVHAKVILVGEEFRLDDLDSTNGTFVNSVRITRCILRNNDLIRIGEARILFVQQRVKEAR